MILAAILISDLTARAYTSIRHGVPFFHTDKFYLDYQGANVTEYNPVNPFLVLQPTTKYPFNEFGLRTHCDVSKKKEPDEFRIFFLGGSTTENITNKYSFSEHLEASLSKATNKTIRCINAARGGYSSNQSVVRMATEVVHLTPDAVIVMDGTNDISELVFPNVDKRLFVRDAKYFHHHYFGFLKNEKVEGDPFEAIAYNSWLNNYKPLNILFSRWALYEHVGQSRESTLREPLIARGVSEFSNNLNSIVALCKSVNAKPIFLTQPMNFASDQPYYWGNERASIGSIYPNFEQYKIIHERYMDVVRNMHADCVDMKALVQTRSDQQEIFYDLMHYTEFGTRTFAELAHPYLMKILFSDSQ